MFGKVLKEGFAEVQAIKIESRTNGSSGLVRADYYDWRTIPGTNHYDVLIGETGAAAVARAIADQLS